MADKSEYDLQREARIRRNEAMLAKLQVRDSASSVAAPARAAQEKEAAAKQARRNKFVATGPVRKSSRAGAVQTAARLQAQAEALSSDDELAASPNTLDEASDDEDVAEASDTSNAGRKRKRGSPEEEFDPADAPGGSEDLSSGSEIDEPEDSSRAASPTEEDEGMYGQDEEDLQLQQALAMSIQESTGTKSQAADASSGPSATQKKQVADSTTNKAAKQQSTAGRAAGKQPAKAQQKKDKKGRKPKGRAGIQDPTPQEMKAAFALLNPAGRSVITSSDILQAADGLGYNFSNDDVSAMMEFAASVTERASTSSMTFQGFQKLVAHYSQTA